MSSLWAILLDISGSMNEPFSGKAEGPGITETGPYPSKLDAAKDYVLKQIRGITSGDIAVVAFASQVQLVCRGQATDTERFRKPIQALTAGGGTNIASALLFALNKLGNLGIYKFIDFVVISDGLSNEGDPIAAAQQCATSSFRIRINTILIDPKDESIQIAQAISGPSGGETKSVTSSVRLATALAERARLYEEELRRREEEEKAKR